MAFCDFVIKYDPKIDTKEDLTKKILFSLFIKRLKAHKPCVVFIGGDSGEGKSLGFIRVAELLTEVQNIDIRQYFDVMNVHTPLEYPQKLDKILFNKDYKKLNIICMHEAREVVKAKMWQSFLTQSIADVNAMSRSIKRLCVFIISQFIRDITNDMRYTLNYYITVRRPKGKHSRLYINVLWKDDRDLEKPKLRKRKISGYLVYPSGRYRRYVPQYLELTKPSKDLIKRFEEADKASKTAIIRRKIDRLINEMKTEIGEESKKIDTMVDWYMQRLDQLQTIGRRYRGKWKLHTEFKEMHELSKTDAQDLELKLNKKLKEKGVVILE